MNRAIPTRAMRMNPPTVGSVQSLRAWVAALVWPFWVRPTRRNAVAIVKIVPPRMSKLRVAAFVLTVGRSRQMKYSERSQTGMLT
jgi:hypothetical protein